MEPIKDKPVTPAEHAEKGYGAPQELSVPSLTHTPSGLSPSVTPSSPDLNAAAQKVEEVAHTALAPEEEKAPEFTLQGKDGNLTVRKGLLNWGYLSEARKAMAPEARFTIGLTDFTIRVIQILVDLARGRPVDPKTTPEELNQAVILADFVGDVGIPLLFNEYLNRLLSAQGELVIDPEVVEIFIQNKQAEFLSALLERLAANEDLGPFESLASKVLGLSEGEEILNNALMRVIEKRNVEEVDVFLSFLRSRDIDLSRKDKFEQTPLTCAVKNFDPGVYTLMMRKGIFDAEDLEEAANRLEQMVATAVAVNDVKLIRELFSSGAVILKEEDPLFQGLLQEAAQPTMFRSAGDKEIFDILEAFVERP